MAITILTEEVLQSIKDEIEALQLLRQHISAEVFETVGHNVAVRTLFPHIHKSISRLTRFENYYGKIDWDRPTAWFRRVEEQYRLAQYAESQLAIDMSKIDLLEPKSILRQIDETMSGGYIKRSLGPNWELCLANILRLNGQSSGSDSLSAEQFQVSITECTDRIIEHWRALRECTSEMKQFKARWSKMTKRSKIGWLQRQFPDLHKRPHADVYAWAQSQGTSAQASQPQSFVAALLNIEDLSRGDSLLQLLKARAKLHPKSFRHIDGQSVGLGLWCGNLKPIGFRGSISFGIEPTAFDGYQYDVTIQKQDFPSLASPTDEPPSFGFYQLKAQEHMYNFMFRCLKSPIDYSESENMSDIADHNDSNIYTLLQKSALLDYRRNRMSSNLQYVRRLLKTSRQEALDDLRCLRTDHEAWITRISESPTRRPGRTANFLRSVAARIDIYHSLDQFLDRLEAQYLLLAPERRLHGDDRGPRHAIAQATVSLHSILQLVLEEQFAQLAKSGWSVSNDVNQVFANLFRILQQNDPIVRVMGPYAIMRVIEEETSRMFTDIPTTVLQTLNDLSVLSVCSRESRLAILYSDYGGKFIELTEKVQKDWKAQHRPWHSVFQGTILCLMAERRINLIDQHVKNEEINPHARHQLFWAEVDKCMGNLDLRNTEDEEVLATVLQITPLDKSLSFEDGRFYKPFKEAGQVETHTTNTAIKRSKKRPVPAGRDEIWTAPAPKVIAHMNMPTVRPSKANIPFWEVLTTPSIPGGKLRWGELVDAMMDIGYEVHNQGGSAYRFTFSGAVPEEARPGAIVFHKLHGRSPSYTYAQARRYWMDRLSKKFRLDLGNGSK